MCEFLFLVVILSRLPLASEESFPINKILRRKTAPQDDE